MNGDEDFILQLKELYDESKIMHIADLLKGKGIESAEVGFSIEDVLHRANSMNALREQCITDDGWILQKESHSVRTLYRTTDQNPGVHSVRLDGDVDAPVFVLLCLFHEVDLFTRWIPSYSLLGLGFAKCVAHPSPTELMVHMNVNIPWPLTDRYCFFKCDGIDCMDDEIPQIGVIMSNLENESEYGVVDDATKTDFHSPSGVLLTPLGGGKTRVQICVNLDPKIDLVPDWLIDFGVRNLAFLIILAIRRAVEIVKSDPEYQSRMTDPTSPFYNHIRRRISESLPEEMSWIPATIPRDDPIPDSPHSSEFSDALSP